MASYFKNSYKYEWENTDSIKAINKYYDVSQSFELEVSLPKLFCYAWNGSSWEKLFQMNSITRVYRTLMQRQENGEYLPKGEREKLGEYKMGATNLSNRNDKYCEISNNQAFLRKILEKNEEFPRESTTGEPDWKFSQYYTISKVLANVQTNNTSEIKLPMNELSGEQIESGMAYRYEIECDVNPLNADAMMFYYEVRQTGRIDVEVIWNVLYNVYKSSTKTTDVLNADITDLTITAEINHQDLSELVKKGPFIRKGVKYSAYQLLRKALLTCDTYILDYNTTSIDDYSNKHGELKSLPYTILIDEYWSNKLKRTTVNETIFEQNNLWEVLLQLGYYLHAIPYMSFANDGTDRFVLSFKQLGSTEEKKDTSQKITIFNSQNLSEYYTQLDSYVTNLFSPQNRVEEWVTPKTSESSFLVSNNTAELHLAYPITEILEFKISILLKNGKRSEFKDATQHLFEKSVYDVICNQDPYKVFPTKGSSVYYSLGSNKIQGLNFVPPSNDNTVFPMALKRIIEILWQGDSNKPNTDNIKFNDMQFYIKYKTQDNVRVNQFRPDIMQYMKNSENETYPHHEQFYGQQGKIIDSERLSANLFGKLIRVGNGVYQIQEYVTGEEKKTGELYRINGEPYYVTAIDTEYYADAILQKVTYSKNFNQLAQIVTIPSEPRFYEIAERSKVRREVRINDFFCLSAKQKNDIGSPRFLNNLDWTSCLKKILFNESEMQLPNYAWNRFNTDKFRDKDNLKEKQMFPSSIITKDDKGVITLGDSSNHSDVIVPLVHYPMHNGIVFSWQMEDNFKAGDYTDKANGAGVKDDAYLSQQPMRYVDIFGRADLFDFRLFYKNDWNQDESLRLPQAVTNPQVNQSFAAVQSKQGENNFLALDKDNREELSFNFQINLLHDEEFITYPNLFGEKIKDIEGKPIKLNIALLDKEQSAFNENQLVVGTNVLASSENNNVNYTFDSDTTNGLKINIALSENSGIDLSQAKSIIFYEGKINSAAYAIYIVRNLGNVGVEEKLNPLYIYPVYN